MNQTLDSLARLNQISNPRIDVFVKYVNTAIQAYLGFQPTYMPKESIKVIECQRAAPEEVGLLAMGQSTRQERKNIEIFKGYLLVSPINGGMHDSMESLFLIQSNNRIAELIAEYRDKQETIPQEIRANLHQGEILIPFNIVCKNMVLLGAARNERNMLDAITAIRPRLKTVCVVLPTGIRYSHTIPLDSEEPLTEYVFTVVEEGLFPLSFLTKDELLGEKGVVMNLFEYLSVIHANGIVHGDSYFKNWGLKNDEIYALDLEAGINFADPSFMTNHKIQLDRYTSQGIESKDELILAAVSNDLERIFSSLSDLTTPFTSNELNLLRECLNAYFNTISISKHLSNVAERLQERVAKLLLTVS